MKHAHQNHDVRTAFAIGATRGPSVTEFASSMSDSERMLRLADEMEAEAEMLVSNRAGARYMRSQAVALRKLARR